MRHNKLYLLITFTLLCALKAKSQEYFSLYNLGDYVIQSQNTSPVYIPKNTFTFAVPIANGSFNFNSGFRVNELIVKNNLTNKLEYNFNNLYNSADQSNYLNVDLTINFFNLAIKRKKGSITVFANSKMTNNWKYSKDFLRIAAVGISQGFSLNEQNDYTGYNEIGFGFTQTFLNNQLAIGIRAKYLNGSIHSSTGDDVLLEHKIDDLTGSYTVIADNATVNSAGSIFNETNGEFKFFTENIGFGFDIGATFKMNEKLTFEFALNDIGYINWKEDVTNFNIEDTGIEGNIYNGINFEDYYNNNTSLYDEVFSLISSTVKAEETSKNFSSKLNMKSYLSAKFEFIETNTLSLVMYNTHAFNEFKPSISMGYNKTIGKSTFGVLTNFIGVENEFSFGANFAVQLGVFQLYGATDSLKAIFAKPEESTGANVSIGLNILFDHIKKDNENY